MKTFLKNKPTFYLLYVFFIPCSLGVLRDDPQFAFGALSLPFVPLGGELFFLHLLKKRNLKYPYIWANVLSFGICLLIALLLKRSLEEKIFTLIYLFSFQGACLYDDIRIFNKRLFKEIKVYAHVPYINRPLLRSFCWMFGIVCAVFSFSTALEMSSPVYAIPFLPLIIISCYFPFLLCCLFKKIGEKMGIVPVHSKYTLYLFDFLGACLAILCAAGWFGFTFTFIFLSKFLFS